MAADLAKLVQAGTFPLWGGMRSLVPQMLHLGAKHLPISEWDRWTIVDPTCGSCATAALFSAYGMRPVVNDLAQRSEITARALFGARVGTRSMLTHLIGRSDYIRPTGVSSIAIADNFLPDAICRTFDQLFWAGERGDCEPSDADYYRYLAILFVMEAKPGMRFLKMPIHDMIQLALQANWTKVCEMAANPQAALSKIMRKVDPLILAIGRHKGHCVARMDAVKFAPEIPWGEHNLISINPPTSGNESFEQSNKLLDSLIANERRKPVKDDVDSAELWTRIGRAILDRAPKGSLVLSPTHDSALKIETSRALLDPYGPPLETLDIPSKNIGLRLARI